MAENVMSPEFRVSYPQVFAPKRNDLNGKDEYSLVMLFDKDADLSKLKAAAKAVMVEKFGADQSKWPKSYRSPFRDQGEREKDGKMPDGYVAGNTFITAKSTNKPGLVDASVQAIIEPSAFYAGCYARATLRPYWYDNKGNKGIAFGLQNIQKLREGESLSGRVSAEAEFSPVEGAGAGSNDADPFK